MTPADYQRIVEICNQPAVKEFVSRDYATGDQGAYTLRDAENFVKFADQCWKNGQGFVYVVRDNEDRIMASLDIKSADLESAEVGCWADTTEGAKGYMTNAFEALAQVAAERGFQELFALVRSDNTASQNLIQRAGFVEQNFVERSGIPGELLKFTRHLAT
jgi:RimJ/RimL family protein N-acetyltransferase